MNTHRKYWDTIFKLHFLLAFALILISGAAHAKFMVEPHWEYLQGKVSTADLDTKKNFSGEMQGINLGFLGDYFMAGLVLQFGRLSFDEDPEGAGNKYYKAGGVGTFLGFHFLDHWKLWTEYQNTNIEPKGDADHRFFGQQAGFGLGYRIVNGVLIYYKYYNNYFTQIEMDDSGKTSSLSSNIRTTGTALGLSFIFVF